MVKKLQRCVNAKEYDTLLRKFYKEEISHGCLGGDKIPFNEALNDEESWILTVRGADKLEVSFGNDVHFCRYGTKVKCYFGNWQWKGALAYYECDIFDFPYTNTILHKFLQQEITPLGTQVMIASEIMFEGILPEHERGRKCSWRVEKYTNSIPKEYYYNKYLLGKRVPPIDFSYQYFGDCETGNIYELYGVESKFEAVYIKYEEQENNHKSTRGFIKEYQHGEIVPYDINGFEVVDIIYTLKDCYIVKAFIEEI